MTELYKQRAAPATIAAASREKVASMNVEQRKLYREEKTRQFDAKQAQADRIWQDKVKGMDADRKQKATLHSEDMAAKIEAAKQENDWDVAEVLGRYKHDERMLDLTENSKIRLMQQDAKNAEEQGKHDTANGIYRALASYAGGMQLEALRDGVGGNDVAAAKARKQSLAIAAATPNAPQSDRPKYKPIPVKQKDGSTRNLLPREAYDSIEKKLKAGGDSLSPVDVKILKAQQKLAWEAVAEEQGLE
jgi:hypothetical protein